MGRCRCSCTCTAADGSSAISTRTMRSSSALPSMRIAQSRASITGSRQSTRFRRRATTRSILCCGSPSIGRGWVSRPDRLAVGGDSAGAHLATVAARGANERVAGLVSAQLLLYPVMRRQFESASCIANANGPGLTNDEMKWYWKQFLSGAEPAADDVRAFPLAEPFERTPAPALIVAAAHDPLYDDAFELARFLESNGGRVELIDAHDMTHGFGRIQAHSPAAAAWMKRAGERIGRDAAPPWRRQASTSATCRRPPGTRPSIARGAATGRRIAGTSRRRVAARYAFSPNWNGLSGCTEHRPGLSFCWSSVSEASVTITSAWPSRICLKIVTLSGYSINCACSNTQRSSIQT